MNMTAHDLACAIDNGIRSGFADFIPRLVEALATATVKVEEEPVSQNMANLLADRKCFQEAAVAGARLQLELLDENRELKELVTAIKERWESLKGMSEQFHGEPLSFSLYPDWLEEVQNIAPPDSSFGTDPVPEIDALLSKFEEEDPDA